MRSITPLLLFCFAMTSSAMAADNKKLPRVLIIGDSISIGYTPVVKKLLEGKAIVVRPRTNCQHTSTGLKKIEQWLGNEKWDVIHFNWGIWDAHMYTKDGKWLGGNRGYPADKIRPCHTHEEYQANLEKLIDIMRKKSDKLIWASTTPIFRKGSGYLERIQGLNRVAEEVMKEKKVPSNDLYKYSYPNARKWLGGDQIHFNRLGYHKLGERVAKSIMQELNKKRR